ncbi:Unknown protein [Striga hermonthica]|uniref:Uncharacterized protein n=1 Tax=Striga hermonthica TaxID=68872 RepID=A0A9N7RJA4_STRHE|nr:Unknown protein [Striga hermonthica]
MPSRYPLSESDIDDCSDSEDDGARYSLEASPQDDKVTGGGAKVSYSRTGSSNNGVVLERKFKVGANFTGIQLQSNFETVQRDFRRGPPHSDVNDGIPSAPPFGGSEDQRDIRATEVNNASDVSTRCVIYLVSLEDLLSLIEVSFMVLNRTTAASSKPLPNTRYPTFRVSGLGHWCGVIAYDACVRLCLHSWSRDGRKEAPAFLANECALLRDAFGLRNILLQAEEELLRKQSPELVGEGVFVKTKKTINKIKIQVRKVKMGFEPPTGCTFNYLKFASVVKMETFHKINVGARRYLKEVPELIKAAFKAIRSSSSSSSSEEVQESYSCMLRLKSSPEEDAVRLLPGSDESREFLPDGSGDDLVIEIHDSKGRRCGQALLQVADIAKELREKVRSCYIYREPEHEQVGRVQLHVSYSTTPDENNQKCTSVAETIAYDCVLETALKIEQFQERKLNLTGDWAWLVKEFAAYYGVSDVYTKLRYLSYVMDVATPTADCLHLVHELLQPVVTKAKTKQLSRQEASMLVKVSEQVGHILTSVFENYKSLDECSPSGIVDVFRPATGVPAPALGPSLKLYKLLHDILTPEAQLKLCRYFQNATKERSKRHLSETDEYVSNNTENVVMDPVALSTAYRKMKSLCLNIQNEILTDIEIHKQDILPSFLDLPNLSSSIYSTQLCSRLRAFLVSCPPAGPTPHVVELVLATADFQRDLAFWNISSIKGGVEAKELFHPYITRWIQDKRLALLELCKLDKTKPSSLPAQHSTASFVNDIYGQIKDTLAEYDIIISRWPEYTFTLENAIADVEKAVIESLERQNVEVLSSLKDTTPIKLGLKYVQKFTKGHNVPYDVSPELGGHLNSMKRMLDTLRPQIQAQLKLWGSCIPESENMVPGECLSEVTVMIRSKFRAYVQAVVDKLVENTKLHNGTKLKKIIQDAKENETESDFRGRMQPLKELLSNTIDQLHAIFDTQVFVVVSRVFWDRMGQDVLKFLEDRKENRAWYKASRFAVNVLDDTFASQMQHVLGNGVQEKDLEPPRSIMEVRSMLCKDTVNQKDNNYYF